MDELTGLTPLGPGGGDPSPGGEDRRIRRTFLQVHSWGGVPVYVFAPMRGRSLKIFMP